MLPIVELRQNAESSGELEIPKENHTRNMTLHYKKLPEAIVPKVGQRSKMGQNGFDRACVSVIFLFLLCFIAHSYEANGGTDMEVLACFRPGFFMVLILVRKP